MAAHNTQAKRTDGRLSPRPAPGLDGTQAVLNVVVRKRAVKSRSDVLRQGDVPVNAHILLDGHTYRYRLLKDGRRQITAILVPGDMCDLEAALRGRADYGVGTLTDCVLGEIPVERIADPAALCPGIARALWHRLLRDEAIAREWLVNMGRRSALGKVAHLVCELRIRLEAVGLASGGAFRFHFTQAEVADALGLSTVHVNRVLQELRQTRLIRLADGTLTVLDVPALEAVAGFDPSYLRTMWEAPGAVVRPEASPVRSGIWASGDDRAPPGTRRE